MSVQFVLTENNVREFVWTKRRSHVQFDLNLSLKRRLRNINIMLVILCYLLVYNGARWLSG